MKKLITLLLALAGMVSTASATTSTIYVKVSGSTAPNIWVFGDGVESVGVDWPGKAMTETTLNGTTVYSYKVNYTGSTYTFLVNYDGDNDKSNNVTTSGDVYYYWAGSGAELSYRGIDWVVAGSWQITADHSEWNGSSTSNKMATSDDETFTLVVNDRVLKAGETYSFKINADSNPNPYAWLPNDNQTFSVENDGVYDITFTYTRNPFAVTATPGNYRAANVSYEYYVWDNESAVTGNEWESNLMTNDGTKAVFYVNEKNLSAGTYKYKIVTRLLKDGVTEYNYWPTNSEDPAGDGSYTWVLTTSSTGDYDVTYKYTISSETQSVDANLGFYLFKEGTPSWIIGDRMSRKDGIYKTTISDWNNKQFAIIPGEYKDAPNWDFVKRPNGSNYSTPVTINWQNYENEGTYTTTTNGGVWKVGTSNDVEIVLSYDPSTGNWSAAPYLERTVTTANVATFSSAYDVAIPSGLTASYVTGVGSNNVLETTNFSSGIPANTGALLIPNSALAETTTYEFTPATSTDAVSDNQLVAATTSTDVTWNRDSKYNYILTTKTVNGSGATPKFYLVNNTSGNTVSAGRAWLQLDAAVQAREYFSLWEEPTAIENMHQDTTADQTVFDLQGRRVQQPTKGLYIVNGKKVIK